MTTVERSGDGFIVPASVLADLFGLTEDAVRQAMRDGAMTTRCEKGEGADAGRWRLGFRHAGRTCRLVVDDSGTILTRTRFSAQTPSNPPRPGTGSGPQVSEDQFDLEKHQDKGGVNAPGHGQQPR